MDLKSIFALSDAKRIFTLAVINLVNGYTSLKNCKKFYDHSYLSEKFKDVHISKDTLAEFLECLGCRGEKVNKYYEKQISNSGGKIAIDGHVVQNFSHENELAQFGNKYNKLDSMQFNLLTMFDIENQLPLKTKVYPGSELDKISVSDFIYGINSKDKKYLFIMDAGFYSKHNIETIGTEYNYIIPLSKNLSDYKNALKDLPLNNEFHYKSNPELKLIKFKEIKSNDKRIFVFKDEILSAKEKGKYLSLIEKNIPGYTKEKYDEIKETIGIIVLQTNLDKPADKIYELYKRR
jgi:transposase